ncbi:hypothetical protein HDU96_007032 [Phlyctochytrium bullatum]|nr:hypothetical protein HDU96_007032 [Phlyctochytrium bullatum]
MAPSTVDTVENLNAGTVEKLFVGTIVHALELTTLEIIHLGAIGVLGSGRIAFVEKIEPCEGSSKETAIEQALGRIAERWTIADNAVIRLKPEQFLCPGFVDTHIHAPQYVFTGTGTDLPLLKWLEKYTFPRESAFADVAYARSAYARAVSRSARCGTTTACYYGTLHLEASKTLVDVIMAIGQRAFVGKVNMDRNSPDYYIETTQSSIRDTAEFVEYTLSRGSTLVTPVLTPRFVPTCTPELMTFLGELAQSKNLPIQSHLSENRNEIKWVAELHPEEATYTGVYHRFGLMTEKTVMAHCVHLSEEERGLFVATKAGVSHCPTSNFSLVSGVLNVRRLLDEGIKVGLGTDVAGGYSPNILDSIRDAIVASKVIAGRSMEDAAGGKGKVYEPLTYVEAFYLATAGGARVMGLEDRVGNFIPGKEFDAIVVDLGKGLNGEEVHEVAGHDQGFEVFPHDDLTTAFEKFIFLGDDRNVSEVWVQGRKLEFNGIGK